MSERGNAEIIESEGKCVCMCVCGCVFEGMLHDRWVTDEEQRNKMEGVIETVGVRRDGKTQFPFIINK